MTIDVVLAVKTEDLETARAWVEFATGLEAEARDSVDLGGAYYSFHGVGEEELKLINNVDLYDGEPIFTETADWKVTLLIVETTENSPALRSLEGATERFLRLSTETD